MPARNKGRAKFDFAGRPFVWWVDGDRWLRIASADKQFAVAFPLLREAGERPVMVVNGQEFPGLPSAARPARVLAPEVKGASLGHMVDELLRWVFDPSRARAETQS